jgi:hypothetical protein
MNFITSRFRQQATMLRSGLLNKGTISKRSNGISREQPMRKVNMV